MTERSAPEPADSGIWTIPNAISVLRLLCVPLFAWLILSENDVWALIVLAGSGFSDWLDGWIARRFNQYSKIGALLDPAADRLFILATILGLAYRDIVPWWLVALILLRELAILCTAPFLSRMGYGRLPVNFIGKAGTFALLYAFPLMLLGTFDNVFGDIASILGWATALWAVALYWVAGIMYIVQTRQLWISYRKATA